MNRLADAFGSVITNALGAAILTEIGTTGFSMYEASANYELNPFKRIKDTCKTCKSGSWLGAGVCGVTTLGLTAVEAISTGVSSAFGGDLGKDEQMLGAALFTLANPLPPFIGAGLSVAATFWYPKDAAMSIVLPAVVAIGIYIYQWRALQDCK